MKNLRKSITIVISAVLCMGMLSCSPSSEDNAGSGASETNASQSPAAPFYVLLVGNDSRTGTAEITEKGYTNGVGRSDTIMLLNIDPITFNLDIVTVPRDTATPYNGKTIKLNQVYAESGMGALEQEVEKLTGADILYTFDMGFVQFEKFVNEINGLDANVPIEMMLKDIVSGGREITLAPGKQHLMGPEALVLARTRKVFETDQDARRQISNRALVETGIQSVASNKIAANVASRALLANCKTTYPAADLEKIINLFVENHAKITINSTTGPHVGSVDENSSLYLIPRDEATWKAITGAINKGENPEGIVELPSLP